MDNPPEGVEGKDALRGTIAAQASEIAQLKARLAAPATTRRNLLKGAGAVAGGLAAIGAVGATGLAAAATPAGAAGWEMPPTYPGARTIALYLKANGQAVPGENFDRSDDGAIECVYFQSSLTTTRNARTGQQTGRRQHEPIVIRKRIDASTPLIAKALCNNEVMAGVFKFFRANPEAEEENFYTVEIKGGRVASFRELSPDNQAAVNGESSSILPMEEVSFVFHTISWVITDGGIEHEDTWNQQI